MFANEQKIHERPRAPNIALMVIYAAVNFRGGKARYFEVLWELLWGYKHIYKLVGNFDLYILTRAEDDYAAWAQSSMHKILTFKILQQRQQLVHDSSNDKLRVWLQPRHIRKQLSVLDMLSYNIISPQMLVEVINFYKIRVL
jgi:hypothetical protein